MTNKLYKGLRVKLWKFAQAGGYSIEKIDNGKIVENLEISLGEPYFYANLEASKLAHILESEFISDSEVIKQSIHGVYIEDEKI